jgi:Asp-tRNA(Asn)/Glu-tRNA(Gln) amidotransferase A subunit family amidase
MADPKTIAGVGKKPPGGYASDLSPDALKGKRIGTYGPGWRNLPLSDEATALYRRALGEIETQGAILVEDPFAGSGFADFRTPTVPGTEYDARGLESLPYDLGRYLERLGPDAAIKTFAEFAAATNAEDPFAITGVLPYMPLLPAFNACLADPTRPPDMSAFIALREQHLAMFNAVMGQHRLDALVFPQMREELAEREADDIIHETTVSEINIAGLPGVTVPAGFYASGSPFNLIFVGPQWSEAVLIGIAFAYEQATHHRKAPTLSTP